MGRKENFVNNMLAIANDNTHGYSQENRWGPNYDCSSMVYTAAHNAGYDVPVGSGYTGTLRQDFINAGFSCLEFDGNVYDLEPGDIILARNAKHGHVEVAVNSGQWVGAHWNYDGRSGDSSGREICTGSPYHIDSYPYDWDWVLTPPADNDTYQPIPAAVNIDDVALAVIRGEYGNGEARKQALSAAGYDYATVQARVNALLS